MQLTADAVIEALGRTDGGKHSARKLLRSQGYKFANTSFDDLAGRAFENVVHSTDEIDSTPPIAGEISSPDARRVRTTARTLVFTCAQNNTKLHDTFWESLMHLVKYKEAELHIARITYNKSSPSAKGAKTDSEKASDEEEVWYDPRIVPYISDQSVQITDDLVWCGELNILPTRVNPLSTLKTYTRKASGIIPHVKLAMESVPGMPEEGPRFLYTTGTVTQRNYIQKIAGQVAEFHHVFGALIVEVDGHDWWVRQINADADGKFYDKTTLYHPDGVYHGFNVEAMVHGDIHIGKKDVSVLSTIFDKGGVVDQLQPKFQFFHDIIDFTPRNHHNIKDPHFLWSTAAQVPVQREFIEAAALLYAAQRPWSTMCVVVSNHDQAVTTWLKNTTAFFDTENVEFWLSLNLHAASASKRGKPVRPFVWALSEAAAGVFFQIIEEDESFILHDTEYGLHGHLGPNGARGSPRNLRVVGKACTAHTHSAGIVEGVYTTGVYGKLDMGYNKGPSSWSHSFVVTYLNGKRAIYTMSKDNKPWRNFDVI